MKMKKSIITHTQESINGVTSTRVVKWDQHVTHLLVGNEKSNECGRGLGHAKSLTLDAAAATADNHYRYLQVSSTATQATPEAKFCSNA